MVLPKFPLGDLAFAELGEKVKLIVSFLGLTGGGSIDPSQGWNQYKYNVRGEGSWTNGVNLYQVFQPQKISTEIGAFRRNQYENQWEYMHE